MIFVTQGTEIEALVQFSNLDIVQEKSGSLTMSLISLNMRNNPGHPLIQEESIITVEDMEYRVKQLTEYRTHKEIQCVSQFFDLIDVRRNTFLGKDLATTQEILDFIFENTPWSYTTNISTTHYLTEFGDDNIIALLKRFCELTGYWFEVSTNKNVIIRESSVPSANNDFQYRYGYNVQALSKYVDTTSLKTVIKGTGAAGIYGTYTAPSAATFGLREADPVSDDSITTVPQLMQYLSTQILSQPQISLELDSIELIDKQVGEAVWLIYEPLEIELASHIMVVHKTIINDHLRSYKVVLGNSIPKNASDLFVETRQLVDKSRKQLARDAQTYQNQLRGEMENLMTLGVPEIY